MVAGHYDFIHFTPINYGVFTLPDTDAETDTDAIGFETHCVGVGTSVGKGKICVGVGQCEHTINLYKGPPSSHGNLTCPRIVVYLN